MKTKILDILKVDKLIKKLINLKVFVKHLASFGHGHDQKDHTTGGTAFTP
jgi:hypothetical protein